MLWAALPMLLAEWLQLQSLFATATCCHRIPQSIADWVQGMGGW
jgi:hypothetical protein